MTHGPPRRSSQGGRPAPRDVGHAPGPPPHSSDAAGELDAASGLTPDQEELLALLLAESAPEAAPTPEVASADASLVVPLKTQGTGPALFAVGVFHFRALAERLDTERPFYGLMGQDVNPDVPYLDQVADLASRYAAVVRQAQPEGPYHLVGFCFGGVVAFEMARQLRARGAEVGALVLIEAFPPEAPTDELNEQRSQNDRLRRHWEAIKERGPRYVLEWVRQRKDYERTRASMVGRRLLARHVYRFEYERPEWYGATVRLETEAAAASGYVPGSYDGDVLAVVGTSDLQRPAWSTFDPGQAAGMWADFVSGSVDVVTFASDRHGDILDVPLVSNLAELVEREVGRTSDAGVRPRRTPR